MFIAQTFEITWFLPKETPDAFHPQPSQPVESHAESKPFQLGINTYFLGNEINVLNPKRVRAY